MPEPAYSTSTKVPNPRQQACVQRAVVKPQATVWVCVPKASSHEFHPFTISSVLHSRDPTQPTIAKLAVKPQGNWAKVSDSQQADSTDLRSVSQS